MLKMKQSVREYCKMLENATKCHKWNKMVKSVKNMINVTKCHKMSQNVTKCHKMSQKSLHYAILNMENLIIFLFHVFFKNLEKSI